MFKSKKNELSHEELISTLDKEASYRKLDGFWDKFITVILLCFTLFQITSTLLGTFPVQVIRTTHLGFVIVLAFLLFPRTKTAARNKMALLDVFLAIVYFIIAVYGVIQYKSLIARAGSYTNVDIILGIIAIILILEACRRVVGLPIVIIASIFIAYALFGNLLPGFLNHRGYSLQRVVTHLFYTTEGIMGTPLGTCATYIFLFILFGAFLEKTGIGQFFIDLANAIAGFSAGGPAKVAVLTSALQGTVSGSSVANTVSTGSFTIPLMKSLGYKAEFAAAVEAAASTGGQIMPPIMGAAAFLIADATNVPYTTVAIAAIIPAILYFTGIWMMIHLEAKKIGLKGIPREQLPKVWPILKERGHLLLPLIVIIVLLALDKTPIYAATRAIVVAAIVPYLRKSTRVPIKDLFEALINGARNIISVACACGVAGIIVGVVTLTGVGIKLGGGLLGLAGGVTILILFFTMVTSIILGMGVPTTANYLITSTIAAPIVMQLGVPALAAHMFAFYFGILADITPPVALAAYAGSAIAKGNPLKTGVQATKLAIAGFIIPYLFVLNPALILIDTTPIQVILITATSLFGMFGISAGMTGYLYSKLNIIKRLVLIVGGVLLINPTYITDIVGISTIVIVILLQKFVFNKKAIN